MNFFHSKSAQTTLELAILFTVLVAALTGMYKYTQRAVQGKFKAGADAVCQRQYEVGKTVITGR